MFSCGPPHSKIDEESSRRRITEQRIVYEKRTIYLLPSGGNVLINPCEVRLDPTSPGKWTHCSTPKENPRRGPSRNLTDNRTRHLHVHRINVKSRTSLDTCVEDDSCREDLSCRPSWSRNSRGTQRRPGP